MQNYFEAEKRRINKMISDARKGKRNEGHVKITMEDVQYALVELQIIGKCSHCCLGCRFAETGEELASLITSTTKSLSQLDYKREKQKQQEGELDWYAKADSKQCVKVDKSGNGLTKLWQQQICQFNAVGIETANAITSHYPSPKALIDKYKSCSSVSEGEQLLQNIQMRRDAGILSSTRRLGPEISKKMYHFYMSDDPDLEL
ncbi:UNVERIFIED_CONTAM: hypothetical protein PYX00_007544 [Menopon gallinae]|uniref:Crossover junction endonuclease EME1 n=1 Tax=Menopon gallinae TaxID=328185 RepID=A0AAW2HKF9_9NEOP